MNAWWKAVLLALFAVVALPAQAFGQLDARDAPETHGPLTAGQKGCDGGKEMHQGAMIALVRLCYRLYLFDPDSEDSAGRDYGVIWLQSTVDAEPGWCTSAVRTSALVTRGGRGHDYAPSDEIRAEDKKRVRRTLKVDAQGNADQNGRITQSFVMFPNKATPTLRRQDGGQRLKLTWTGYSARNLGFATGLELSWPADGTNPQIDPKLTYDFTADPNGC